MRTAKSAIVAQAGEDLCDLENARVSLLQIDGVFHVEANHILGILEVEYDQDRVSLDQIRRIIKKACNERSVNDKNMQDGSVNFGK